MKQDKQTNPIIIYQDSANNPAINIRLENETLWLTQRQIAELFDKDRSVITKHIKNIFEEGELVENSVCAKIAHTANDGKTYETLYYNLDMIISVGYRVNSKRATQFRQWASKILKEYLVKGFVLDDERLKGQKQDYFDELLERLRDIRSSEARMHAQVLKIFSTAVDYDKDSSQVQELFKTIQNKLHYSAHGRTASEIIFQRADSDKINMGLTNFKGKMPTKKESEIAKNYLNQEELEALNRIVTAYFEFAELSALNREQKSMQEHLEKLNEFLKFSGREVLQGAGKISHQKALEKAHKEYNLYKQKTKEEIEIAYEEFNAQTKALRKGKANE
ncbi:MULTISPECIES: virulence RhuM family protein [Helicobacter]|uniref:Cell filamentation protein Fic n=6 Tax=Helicobacter typhlonius TaxID=76936 RepID=A0A099UGS1_9HELI|nr:MULTISPECIES: virulence RhuM family protein [Helicobacter]TLD78285.1 cell filamentation protein Fic [Helicobacter typhlonius]CUU38962.1 Putative DNA-binding protein in cluster with Type I restriction-modification system [Helicobacter typhlonius]